MAPLATAIALIILSVAVALGEAGGMDASQYFDIKAICDRVGETPQACTSAAFNAGIISLIGALLAGVLLLAVVRRYPDGLAPNAVAGRAFAIFASIVAAWAALNVFLEASSPLPLSREEPFWQRPAEISVGNLLWPICIQLANRSGSMRWRLAFLSLLVPILAFSPFRGMLFAVAVFAAVVPLTEFGIRYVRLNGLSSGLLLKFVAIVVVVGAVVAQAVIVETLQRTSSLDLAGKSVGAQFVEKMTQRTTIPLFQAHLAYAKSLDPDLPSFSDELATKFHLRSGRNINSYLFSQTFGTAIGETTSLLYGESALRTGNSPVVWIIVAPWMLIITWALLRERGFDASTLFALAIWRGSLGGLVSVLPALTIQVVLFYALTRLEKPEGKQ